MRNYLKQSYQLKEVKYCVNTLFFLFTLLFIACNNDDDNNSGQNPISQLPPATQTGANTFGCLLDGEPFLPGGGTNPLDCVYQLINGERFFNVQGNAQDENFNLIGLSLSTNAKEIQEESTYILIENNPNNAFGGYFFNSGFVYTDSTNSGELHITHLDLINQTVSGTFFFDVVDQNGHLHEIRDGRFDMQFTQ
ncbi:hypothetical protein [Winogradskyella wichelsiae]|uniref:hypothetical protein n=1 Tax=Winogradskyella wichelsiae TaxID=2697007 RepID=UPI003EF2B6FE